MENEDKFWRRLEEAGRNETEWAWKKVSGKGGEWSAKGKAMNWKSGKREGQKEREGERKVKSKTVKWIR